MSFENAVAAIISRATTGNQGPLGVLSANLDHINHFGAGRKWAGTFEGWPSVEWLTLLDGAPLVQRANNMTAGRWPRLAGSDLIGPILDRAAHQGLTVGFLGGSTEAHTLVQQKFARERPDLRVSGWWAPERDALEDPGACRDLCAEIAEAGIDILVVCLGKPRQELWIGRYGAMSGAKVLLAFGAVVDFLAGKVQRAPVVVRDFGLEWAWRLAQEPRRLARRYMIDGPRAYRTLQLHSRIRDTRAAGGLDQAKQDPAASVTPGLFAPASAHTDVAVLVVTYNNQLDMPNLLQSLRHETAEQSIKVVVADNSPNMETLGVLAQETDVLSFPTGGNRGYAGGINSALERAGTADSYLVLNPDLRLEAGAVRALRQRMASSEAAVVVPLLLDEDGETYPSLRREPSLLRAAGDAVLGGRVRHRSGCLTEMDFDKNSYLHPHRVDWATGAALLIRADLAADIGPWDEQFFLYSEEVDFFRRARQLGAVAWFEPESRMVHRRGGSGESPELTSLMAVNRIRYARKYGGPGYAALIRCIVAVGELARAALPGHWQAFRTVVESRKWEELPRASWYSSRSETPDFPEGAVIIPAHNEAAVIGRTLATLAPSLSAGTVEVIVACNDCSDGTEEVAASFPGVCVITVPEASKVAALNAGDRAATRWPRIYLDADIDLPAGALRRTLTELTSEAGPLAARPAFRYDTNGAAWSVRAYFRARSRIPGTSSALWGAGVYGISQRGHERFSEFPPMTGDDLYIDGLYSKDEKQVLECVPVLVRTPRSPTALLHTLKRVYRGNTEQRSGSGAATKQSMHELIHSVRGPISALDAVIYAAFAVSGRLYSRGVTRTGWERDDSSRIPNPEEVFGGGLRP
ncbi:WecB/TagA/CpsF family glycosyltransferase [Arthrobacter sp. BE255]|uniref:WecB/TagA/CpsF family glycosyltransferase n=1 Tax=Arthrobacter sp. BE255 TaxID=2817721 RepID=UPI00286B33C6|nr:WecB/TagA/CpsF family glycosyltransferase [Arthrobacter sp. BE255]